MTDERLAEIRTGLELSKSSQSIWSYYALCDLLAESDRLATENASWKARCLDIDIQRGAALKGFELEQQKNTDLLTEHDRLIDENVDLRDKLAHVRLECVKSLTALIKIRALIEEATK